MNCEELYLSSVPTCEEAQIQVLGGDLTCWDPDIECIQASSDQGSGEDGGWCPEWMLCLSSEEFISIIDVMRSPEAWISVDEFIQMRQWSWAEEDPSFFQTWELAVVDQSAIQYQQIPLDSAFLENVAVSLGIWVLLVFIIKQIKKIWG